MRRYDRVHDLAVDVREPEVAARVPEYQPLVVEPHQVQQGRVEVVHVHLVLRRVEAVVVGGAVAQARAGSARA